MISSLLDKLNDEDVSNKTCDSFLRTCHQINERDYLFANEGNTGVYRDTSIYLNRQEALDFIAQDAHWVIQHVPSSLPSDRAGSYFFLVDSSSHVDPKKELTNDFLKPWSSLKPDGKQRVTPKWEKFPANPNDGNIWIRVSKSRHPRFPWIKRMMVFLSTNDGFPSSNVFYQYAIEPKRDETNSLDVMKDNGELLDPEETASVSSASELSRTFGQNEIPRFSFKPNRFLSADCSESVQNVYNNINEQLKSMKRRYCDATEVEEMRYLSASCERLAVLEKETRLKMLELSQQANRQLQEILAVDEPSSKMLCVKEE